LRKYQEVAPSKGDRAITKKQAEVERDKFLGKLNAGSKGIVLIGRNIWRRLLQRTKEGR
jgi:hypothetical protein